MLRHSKYERGWKLDDLASMTVENRSYAKGSSRERARVRVILSLPQSISVIPDPDRVEDAL